MSLPLFDDQVAQIGTVDRLGSHAYVLRGLALEYETRLWQAFLRLVQEAPLRRVMTPGGRPMSAWQTNCGALGWTTDKYGYRYVANSPVTGKAWPDMPSVFQHLAMIAAERAGFSGFSPDSCLINRYEPGARMALHQDKDEQDLSAPVVSVSLGLTTLFLFGGLKHIDPVRKVVLAHGDVVVWGAQDRLRFHGVAALRAGVHRLCGQRRVNLTFRRAVSSR